MRVLRGPLSVVAVAMSVNGAAAMPPLWDGGLLPEHAVSESTFTLAAIERAPFQASHSAIDLVAGTAAVSEPDDEIILANIAAFISDISREQTVVLLNHEDETSFPSIFHVAEADYPTWDETDVLASPAVLAGLVAPPRRFLLEDEDLLGVHYTGTAFTAVTETEMGVDGYEDR